MQSMRRLIGGVSLCFLLLSQPVAARDYSWPSDAPYSVSKTKMKDALECRSEERISRHGAGALTGDPRKQPILLVHGTGTDREQNWSWNYWDTLWNRGWEVCWIQLPNAALGDIQVSSEYVAHALRLMHRASGEKIDVLGHSQGGLQPRWAIKWFASGRFVADYIALATPNHGTRVANESSFERGCFPACWQMQRGSMFIKALNRDTETPGPIHYTSIYTATDQLVQPVGTQRLAGASNILIQDVCPGRTPDHVFIAADFVTWVLVRDALLHPGPADPRIIGVDDCARVSMPGAEDPPANLADLFDFEGEGRLTDHEPPLKRYARP